MEEMPARAYTVGDEVRLEIEIACEANLESAKAHFYQRGGQEISFTLYGDVVLDETDPYEEREYHPNIKKFRTELVSLVDDDHTLGVYHLDNIMFQTAGGGFFFARTGYDREGQGLDPLQFRIVRETTNRFRIKVALTDPPASD